MQKQIMNKRDFKIWKEGVEIAMFIVGQHIRCPMVEDKVRAEVEHQARKAAQEEISQRNIAEEFEKFFADVDMAKASEAKAMNDFGWEEPVKGASTKKDIGWQSKFKKHFGNGPVKRRARQ